MASLTASSSSASRAASSWPEQDVYKRQVDEHAELYRAGGRAGVLWTRYLSAFPVPVLPYRRRDKSFLGGLRAIFEDTEQDAA